MLPYAGASHDIAMPYTTAYRELPSSSMFLSRIEAFLNVDDLLTVPDCSCFGFATTCLDFPSLLMMPRLFLVVSEPS